MNDLFPTTLDSVCIEQRDGLELLASLDAGSVQVIIADPPYGIAYHSNYYVGKNPHAPIARDWNFQIASLLSAAARTLADGGALYLFTRWDVMPLWAGAIMPPLKLSNAIVWKKDNWSAGDLSGNFGNQYELIMFITKGRHSLRGRRWSNVWEAPRIPAKKLLVAAQKPVELYRRAIESSSDEGDLIVDPCCGSGTTAVAALATKRLARLADIDPAAVDIARQRIGLESLGGVAGEVPFCPVFRVEPPSLSWWGLHPEDLCHIATKVQDGAPPCK